MNSFNSLSSGAEMKHLSCLNLKYDQESCLINFRCRKYITHCHLPKTWSRSCPMKFWSRPKKKKMFIPVNTSDMIFSSLSTSLMWCFHPCQHLRCDIFIHVNTSDVIFSSMSTSLMWFFQLCQHLWCGIFILANTSDVVFSSLPTSQMWYFHPCQHLKCDPNSGTEKTFITVSNRNVTKTMFRINTVLLIRTCCSIHIGCRPRDDYSLGQKSLFCYIKSQNKSSH